MNTRRMLLACIFLLPTTVFAQQTASLRKAAIDHFYGRLIDGSSTWLVYGDGFSCQSSYRWKQPYGPDHPTLRVVEETSLCDLADGRKNANRIEISFDLATGKNLTKMGDLVLQYVLPTQIVWLGGGDFIEKTRLPSGKIFERKFVSQNSRNYASSKAEANAMMRRGSAEREAEERERETEERQNRQRTWQAIGGLVTTAAAARSTSSNDSYRPVTPSTSASSNSSYDSPTATAAPSASTSSGYSGTSNQRPQAQGVPNCLRIEAGPKGQLGGPQHIVNTCPFEVEAAWSEPGQERLNNRWSLGIGGSYPVKGGVITYNACRGRNTIMKTEGKRIWCFAPD
ncbi:hypothetical protein [Thermomonas sp.]|uniref:hypothetical protein n=1 Tax=Thermomonas sp. TaxID=1971895 RepID=UPI0039E4DE10